MNECFYAMYMTSLRFAAAWETSENSLWTRVVRPEAEAEAEATTHEAEAEAEARFRVVFQHMFCIEIPLSF